MTVERFDRATAKAIAGEVREALGEVARRHGLTLTVGGGSYYEDSFAPKVKFEVEGADAAAFARSAPLVGLEPGDFGRVVKDGRGKSFALTAINLRAPRFPIVAKCAEDGKSYKLTEQGVARMLGRKP
jgi:hypothetical protein